MEKIKGNAASAGIAKGITCLYSDRIDDNVPHYAVLPKAVDGELKRLNEAFDKARISLEELSGTADAVDDPDTVKELIRAHLMIIGDEDLRAAARGLVEEKLINAEHAASDAFDAYSSKLSSKGFHFADIAHDIDDVKKRVLSFFSGPGGKFDCPVGERQPVIVVAKKLTPSMVLDLPREHVLAFLTEEGGLTTHASILARSYNVPILYGIDVSRIECAQDAIVDATREILFLEPDEDTAQIYRNKLKELEKRKKTCAVKKSEPAQTRQGSRVKLKINITSPGEVELVGDINYDGVGLLRTEFLFKNKSAAPDFEEQRRMYEHILDQSGDKPVTVRLLDIAGDKLPPYMTLPPQDNPDLGIRGARAADIFKEVYVTQIKAVLCASREGRVGILYPMVSDLSDIAFFDTLLDRAKDELESEGMRFDKDVRKGIMIETPAAAINSEMLLKEVDFANLGSNDLIQYTLAASRGSKFIEDRYHIMHPALLRLMRIAALAGEKLGKEVCLCGEIAGFEKFYPVLLNIGLRSFSVPPALHEELKCNLLYSKPSDKDEMKRFWLLRDKEQIDSFFKE